MQIDSSPVLKRNIYPIFTQLEGEGVADGGIPAGLDQLLCTLLTNQSLESFIT